MRLFNDTPRSAGANPPTPDLISLLLRRLVHLLVTTSFVVPSAPSCTVSHFLNGGLNPHVTVNAAFTPTATVRDSLRCYLSGIYTTNLPQLCHCALRTVQDGFPNGRPASCKSITLLGVDSSSPMKGGSSEEAARQCRALLSHGRVDAEKFDSRS